MALENENTYSRLEELSEGNYQVVEGEPDITGWDVKDTEGQLIGEVTDLLFDPQSRKVRYLIVDLEDNEVLQDSNYQVAVPIGVADLYDNDDEVILAGVSASQLSLLPPYDRSNFNPQTEASIRSVFDGMPLVTYERDGFYDHDHFNDQRFYDRTNRRTDMIDTKPDSNTESAGFTTRIADRQSDELPHIPPGDIDKTRL